MSTSHAETRDANQSRAIREARKHPWWFAGFGAVLVLLGVVAVAAAFWATLATVLFFGALLLIAGIIRVIDAGATSSEPGFAWRLLSGILGILVGGLIIFDPVSGAIGLTLLLAMFFVFEGVLRLIVGAQLKGDGKGWLIAGGVIDLLLGLLIAIQWPASGVWVIGLFLGIDLICSGLTVIMLATLRRRLALL